MREDAVLRLALWVIRISSSGSEAEAFTGDLLEFFHAGRSCWWCFGQSVLRGMSTSEERLRRNLLPLVYCIGFVLLHPLWQRLYAPPVAGLLTRYRGTICWPGSAVLEMMAGLLPAVLFLFVGVFVYALLRRRSLQSDSVAALLSLNVGACLLFVAMLVRLHVLHNDLRLLSGAEFYYPLVHGRFSLLLFVSLFGAVLMLPRTEPPRRRSSSNVLVRFGLERIAKSMRLRPLRSTAVSTPLHGLHGAVTRSSMRFLMSGR
jgi:hypothetical protein